MRRSCDARRLCSVQNTAADAANKDQFPVKDWDCWGYHLDVCQHLRWGVANLRNTCNP